MFKGERRHEKVVGLGNKTNNTPQVVKVVGERTAHETKVLATYNSTIYCLLVVYQNGSRELIECDTKGMKKYLPYIEV